MYKLTELNELRVIGGAGLVLHSHTGNKDSVGLNSLYELLCVDDAARLRTYIRDCQVVVRLQLLETKLNGLVFVGTRDDVERAVLLVLTAVE